MSNYLWPRGLQHTRIPCPSVSPGVCSDSCPLSQGCYLAIILCCPLRLLLSVFPSIGCFSMSQLFVSGGQSIRASASASVFPVKIQGWFPLGLADLISLQSKWLWSIFSNTTIQKHQIFSTQPSLYSDSHIHTWIMEKSWFCLYSPCQCNREWWKVHSIL